MELDTKNLNNETSNPQKKKYPIDKSIFEEFFSVTKQTTIDIKKSFNITVGHLPKNLSNEQFKVLSSDIKRIQKTNLIFSCILAFVFLFTFIFVNYTVISDSQKVKEYLIQQSYSEEIKLTNPYEHPQQKISLPSREEIEKVFPDYTKFLQDPLPDLDIPNGLTVSDYSLPQKPNISN